MGPAPSRGRARAARQILELDHVGRRKRHGAFDEPLEFADVAGPVVGEQRVGRGGRQAHRPPRPVAFQKIPRELEDVVAPLAQRRHADVDAGQPVEQIRPELSPFDKAGEAPIGRGNDPEIDAMRSLPADTLDRQVLQRAQQLGLRGGGKVGHLVEKQGSPVGLLELATTAADAGRRALLDAEELGLDQRFNQRGAVDGHERPAATGAELVNLARDELLADAAFARERCTVGNV